MQLHLKEREVIGMTRVGELIEPEFGVEPATHTLDLARPELAPLRNRYANDDPPRTQTSIFAPPAALIVEHKGQEERALRDEIESDGWFVKTCPGPANTRCPLMRGESCTLRESVDAAIVFVPKQVWPATGTLPRLRCAADSASPSIVVLEGRMDAPREVGRTATIGAMRGPIAILAALRRVLQRPS